VTQKNDVTYLVVGQNPAGGLALDLCDTPQTMHSKAEELVRTTGQRAEVFVRVSVVEPIMTVASVKWKHVEQPSPESEQLEIAGESLMDASIFAEQGLPTLDLKREERAEDQQEDTIARPATHSPISI
jgi:hypothetical protein